VPGEGAPGSAELSAADQAKPGSASEATTLEVPLDWGKDVKESAKKVGERVEIVVPQGTLKFEILEIRLDG